MHQMNNNNNQIDSDVINQLEAYKEQIQKEQSEKLVIFENYQELEKDVQNYKNQQEFYQQQLSDKISLQEELMKAIECNLYSQFLRWLQRAGQTEVPGARQHHREAEE